MQSTECAASPSQRHAGTINPRRPIRILHVVGRMNRAGAETWLMHVLRTIDRQQFSMDFLVHTHEACVYDAEIRSLGSQIIPCLLPENPWLYAKNFKKVWQKHGPYDVIHSHVHYFSGYVLWLASQLGDSLKIAHSHIDASPLEADAGLRRRLYLASMKALITHNANLCLGCSQIANVDLFGSATRNPAQILYYGIDLTPFQEPIDFCTTRSQLGIPVDGFVVGHVGRFQEQKNHQFLIEIFAEISKRDPNAYLLLVGEGPLRPRVEQQVAAMGLQEYVIFAGSRSDVPQLMLGGMDLFLFPSLCEGLPLVLIEAQAAGLTAVISDVISEEVDIIPPLMQRLSLAQSADIWAEQVLSAHNHTTNVNQHDCLATLANNKFNINSSVKQLTDIYQDEYQKRYQYREGHRSKS